MYIREKGEMCPLMGMRCQELQLVRIYESTEVVAGTTVIRMTGDGYVSTWI